MTILDRVDQPTDADHRRQSQGAGEDRGMRGGRALLGGETDHQGAIESRRLRRGEVPRHHDRRFFRRRRQVADTVQRPADLLDHVFDVDGTSLEDRIG